MRFHFLLYILFILCIFSEKNVTKEKNEENKEELKKNYKNLEENKSKQIRIHYKVLSNKNIDTSGFKGFLPKYYRSDASYEEIVHYIIEILAKKGIDLIDLKIKKYIPSEKKDNNIITSSEQEDSILIEIYTKKEKVHYTTWENNKFIEKKSFFRKIAWHSSLKILEDKLQEMKKDDPLFNFSNNQGILNTSKKEAINIFIEILLKQFGVNNITIKEKIQDNNLIFYNYHHDIPIPKIKYLNIIFVKYVNGIITYNIKTPKDIDIDKVKENLLIEEENSIRLLLSFFFNLPFSKVFLRDGQQLQEYFFNLGYKDSELLDLKFIKHHNNDISAIVYIKLGDKLPVVDITFSCHDKNYTILLGELSKIKNKILKNKKILQEDYIPNTILKLCEKHIRTPFQIKKNITEVKNKKGKLFYIINFTIEAKKKTQYIENIMFVNNYTIKNPLKLCKVKIGDKLSQEKIQHDVELLSQLTKEKVIYELVSGKKTNGKVLIYKLQEDLNYQKIITDLLPSFSLNLKGINLSKEFKLSPIFFDTVIPISLLFELKKRILDDLEILKINRDQQEEFYCLDSKIKIDIVNLFEQIVNKEFGKNLILNFSLGCSILPFKSIYNKLQKLSQDTYNDVGTINSFLVDCFLATNHIYNSSTSFFHYINIFYNYNIRKNKLIKLNDVSDNVGFQYLYGGHFNKQNFLNHNDNLAMEFGIRDKIKYKILHRPTIEWNIDYLYNFLEYIFFESKIQIIKSIILKNNKDKGGIHLVKLKVIGIEEYEDSLLKYSFALNFLGQITGQVYSFDIFLGKKVKIYSGFFLNLLTGIIKNTNQFQNRLVIGIIINFHTEFGTLTIYLNKILTHEDILDKELPIDFSLNGGPNRIIQKPSKWKNVKTDLLISDH